MVQRATRAKKSATSPRALALEPSTGTDASASKSTKAKREASALARREAGAIDRPARKRVRARRAGTAIGKLSKSEFLRWWKTLSEGRASRTRGGRLRLDRRAGRSDGHVRGFGLGPHGDRWRPFGSDLEGCGRVVELSAGC